MSEHNKSNHKGQNDSNDEWVTDSDADNGGEPLLLNLKLKTALARKIQEDYNELADIVSGCDHRGQTEVTHWNLALDSVKDLLSFVVRAERILINWYESGSAPGSLGQLPSMVGGMDKKDLLRMFNNEPVPELVLPKYESYKDQDKALYDATKRTIEIVEIAGRDKLLHTPGLFYKFSLGEWVEENIHGLILSAFESIEDTLY